MNTYISLAHEASVIYRPSSKSSFRIQPPPRENQIMSSTLLSATLQAVLFSALSNTLAQALTIYQHQNLSLLDPKSFLNFILIAIIMTPINCWYQRLLEDRFPAHVAVASGEVSGDGKRTARKNEFSVLNTATKFIADQSLGAAFNTFAFIVLMGTLKGRGLSWIAKEIQQDFWPMLSAGYSFWPLITLLNLVVVPFDQRALVGNTAGLLWGTYMTLRTM